MLRRVVRYAHAARRARLVRAGWFHFDRVARHRRRPRVRRAGFGGLARRRVSTQSGRAHARPADQATWTHQRGCYWKPVRARRRLSTAAPSARWIPPDYALIRGFLAGLDELNTRDARIGVEAARDENIARLRALARL